MIARIGLEVHLEVTFIDLELAHRVDCEDLVLDKRVTCLWNISDLPFAHWHVIESERGETCDAL